MNEKAARVIFFPFYAIGSIVVVPLSWLTRRIKI